jgi:hypothetical protein
MKEVVTDSTKG